MANQGQTVTPWAALTGRRQRAVRFTWPTGVVEDFSAFRHFYGLEEPPNWSPPAGPTNWSKPWATGRRRPAIDHRFYGPVYRTGFTRHRHRGFVALLFRLVLLSGTSTAPPGGWRWSSSSAAWPASCWKFCHSRLRHLRSRRRGDGDPLPDFGQPDVRFSRNDYQLAQLETCSRLATVALSGGGLDRAGVLPAKWLPKTPLLGRLILAPPDEAEQEGIGLRRTARRFAGPAGKSRRHHHAALPRRQGPIGDPGRCDRRR